MKVLVSQKPHEYSNVSSFEKRKSERGFSLVEMGIVLSIFTIIVAGVYYIYKQRIEPNTWATSKFNTINSVLTAIEQAKSSRGGVYPAYNGAITNSNVLVNYLTRDGVSSNDLMGVQYSCDAGVNKNLTITVPVNDGSKSGIQVLIDKLTSAGLQAGVNGSNLVVTISGANCK